MFITIIIRAASPSCAINVTVHHRPHSSPQTLPGRSGPQRPRHPWRTTTQRLTTQRQDDSRQWLTGTRNHWHRRCSATINQGRTELIGQLVYRRGKPTFFPPSPSLAHASLSLSHTHTLTLSLSSLSLSSLPLSLSCLYMYINNACNFWYLLISSLARTSC